MINEEFLLDDAGRRQVVEQLLSKVKDHYLFADVAEEIVRTLQSDLDGKVYEAITSGSVFAQVLTEQLRMIGRDRHLFVSYSEQPQPEPAKKERHAVADEEVEQWRIAESVRQFGFERIERLAGNIGYLDLRGFAEARWATETVMWVMNILGNTSALILDLRQNRGGWPSMVHLLVSYFFADEVHLGEYHSREDHEVRQYRTFPYLAGAKYVNKPVYLLVSRQTFSAAEGFANHLRAQKRAIIIGETTGGGIYIGRPFYLTPHFQAWISTGGMRSEPLSADEEPGIVPDIIVPSAEALTRAHAEALKSVLDILGEQPYGALIGLKEEAEAAYQKLADL
ncbi:S41 family peptidase [Tengunoibacter tsumagoiensis]|uniref:Interphotoreceptor retinoid-binding protein n=1 Tax=Tengunoibacter tsumagoiensis TaxID=2014871 RepID=A0A402A8K9_9CHLR|nr:S41 family peptidase [Tengunoibacter tsumagoiensis]GCE15428.1 interphotoreceptor retinoid-binding protein [Tengunoibacter tsumagoiensis]